jgi:hypothetical protein
MADICDLVLDDHEELRRRFAELDEAISRGDTSAELLLEIWKPLAELLDLHAATEESLFYPKLLEVGARAEDETEDAISDHNSIRDAVSDANGQKAGSEQWWQAVNRAREENSDHMGEEERGAVADMRSHMAASEREVLGSGWLEFKQRHAHLAGIEVEDKDPDRYIAENGP